MPFNEMLNKKCKSLLLAMTVVAICLLIALLAATTGKIRTRIMSGYTLIRSSEGTDQ